MSERKWSGGQVKVPIGTTADATAGFYYRESGKNKKFGIHEKSTNPGESPTGFRSQGPSAERQARKRAREAARKAKR